MNRGDLIDRLADVIASKQAHPRGITGVIEDGETSLGAKIVPLGSTEPFPFPVADWDGGVVSILGNKARIVVINARREGHGAFRRLVDGIEAAGYLPAVIEPVGTTMPAILRRWGWKRHVRGSGWERYEEWTPKRLPAPHPLARISGPGHRGGTVVSEAACELINITIEALERAPEDWAFTRHEATNEKLGIVIWIANSHYGLNIRGPGVTAGESAPLTGWLMPWRRKVLALVGRIAASELRKRFNEIYPAPLASGGPGHGG